MSLIVYSDGLRIGTLDMEDSEPFYGFTYDPAFLASHDAAPLSLSLPLQTARFSGSQTLPYFEGLLPEGDVRAAIARQLGISENSPAKLLEVLGKDCAGDVAVLEEDDPYQPPADDVYAPLSEGLELIARNPRGEIARLREDNRLSLAGGQEKIALYHDERRKIDAGWHIPLAGSPSTHIIKPQADDNYPQLVYNEFLCMRLARQVGLIAAEADIIPLERPLLVIKRFDREMTNRTNEDGLAIYRRLKQEDFCQALGFDSRHKYETDGGPGISDLSNALLAHSTQFLKDCEALLRLVLFNYLLGNCDAHAKNYSLMLGHTGNVRLAPAYDLVSTTVYDGTFGGILSKRMGMGIGAHSNIDQVTPDDFVLLAEDIGIRLDLLIHIARDLLEALPTHFGEAADDLRAAVADDVSGMTERIRAGIEKRSEVIGAL